MEESPPQKTTAFIEPVKRINNQGDLQKFLAGPTCAGFLDFLERLSVSVHGKKVRDEIPVSPIVEACLRVLDRLDQLIDETPPMQQPMRYGNKAFRTWHDRVQAEAGSLALSLLPDEKKAAAVELRAYLAASVGDHTRIDYGTGHEAAFACFLFCLERLGLVTPVDHPALVLRIFHRYIVVMRRLQTVYWLEPAGSHGVWSLDDYQFLVFYWGAAQLIGQRHLKPSSVRNPEAVDAYAEDYLYLHAIQFINKVKSGPFGEHSPILNDVSAVGDWAKVNQGMKKMFTVEVLGKFPIMQHFLFGSLIPFA